MRQEMCHFVCKSSIIFAIKYALLCSALVSNIFQVSLDHLEKFYAIRKYLLSKLFGVSSDHMAKFCVYFIYFSEGTIKISYFMYQNCTKLRRVTLQ